MAKEILERFIKEITQNIADETGVDGEFVATIIRKWEEYQEHYLTSDNNLLCKMVNKLQEQIIELNDRQGIDLNCAKQDATKHIRAMLEKYDACQIGHSDGYWLERFMSAMYLAIKQADGEKSNGK